MEGYGSITTLLYRYEHYLLPPTDENTVDFLTHKRVAAGKGGFKPWHALLIIGVIFILFFTNLGASLQSSIDQNLPNQPGTTPTTGLSSVTKPIDWNLQDALGGSAMGSATIQMYRETSQGAVQLESLTTASDGTIASGGSFKTGETLWVEVTSSGDVNEFIKVVVPGMSPADAESLTVNSINIYGIQLGDWSLDLTATGGSELSDGGAYLISQFAGSSATITVTISETSNNEGYVSQYDPIYKINRYMVMQIIQRGTSLDISGLPNQLVKGSTVYYHVTLPDGLTGSPVGTGYDVSPNSQSFGTKDSIASGSVSQRVVGSTVYGGTAAFSFTIKAGSLTAGSVEDVDFLLYAYADPDYYSRTNSLGPDAAQQGSTFDTTWRG